MGGIGFWVTMGGILVVLLCLRRAAKTLFPNGVRDAAAVAVYRRAGLLPLAVMVGALLLVGVGMQLFPEVLEASVWVIPAVALGGCLWVFERGIREVRAYRRDEEEGKRGRHHPWPYRRRG